MFSVLLLFALVCSDVQCTALVCSCLLLFALMFSVLLLFALMFVDDMGMAGRDVHGTQVTIDQCTACLL
jgi:hypothetical protein